ncbi:MAG TPA: hypothetical protein VG709_00945, partial [Actinomycetota bacterium]|nr:hypothetical protein [Actinomycetota bacterium]
GGGAEWDGRRAVVRADDDDVRATLQRVFRVSPVVTPDPAARPTGSRADAIVEPGTLEWFREAAAVRGEAEGLSARFVTTRPGGWDPAGSYVPMELWVGRREGDVGRLPSLGTSRA